MTVRARYASLVCLTLVGCAAGPVERTASRASAGTLVDESHEGTYDTWDVLPATVDDASIVIAASGPSGATGTARFFASDDGSATIIIEAEGASTQVDFDADGTLAGEAHAAAPDALLAEMIADLDARQDELASLTAPTAPVSEDGAAREALGLGFDFSCTWNRVVAWWYRSAAPVCGATAPATSELRLLINSTLGATQSVSWKTIGTAGPEHALALDERSGSGLTWAIGDLPHDALATGVEFRIDFGYPGRAVRTKRVHTRGGWSGSRTQVIVIFPFCGRDPCEGGVCIRSPELNLLCSDTF